MSAEAAYLVSCLVEGELVYLSEDGHATSSPENALRLSTYAEAERYASNARLDPAWRNGRFAWSATTAE